MLVTFWRFSVLLIHLTSASQLTFSPNIKSKLKWLPYPQSLNELQPIWVQLMNSEKYFKGGSRSIFWFDKWERDLKASSLNFYFISRFFQLFPHLLLTAPWHLISVLIYLQKTSADVIETGVIFWKLSSLNSSRKDCVFLLEQRIDQEILRADFSCCFAASVDLWEIDSI